MSTVRKRIITIVVLVIIVLLLFRTCGSSIKYVDRKEGDLKHESSYFIPPHATFISSFNLNQILAEIDFESLKQSQAYTQKLQSFYAQNPPFTSVFRDPVKAGIDINKKAIFYIDVGESAKEVYSASVFTLSSAGVFDEMIAQMRLRKTEKSEWYQVVKIDGQSSVAWSDQFVMFISSDEKFDKKNILEQCFNPKAKKYFDGNQNYLSHFESSKSDVAFWLDLTSYADNQIHAKGKPGEINKSLLKGNYLYGDFDFGLGQLDIDIRFLLNDILKDFVSNVFKADYDKSILLNIPDKTPSFLALSSLNLQTLLNFITKDPAIKLEARNSLVEYGLVLDDFVQAFTGDIMFVSYPSDNPEKSTVGFAVKIKDKSHFNKLLKVWEDIGKITKEGEGLFKMEMGVSPVFPMEPTYDDKLQRMILKDEFVYVSLDKQFIENIQLGQVSNRVLAEKLNNQGFSNKHLTIYGNNQFKAVAGFSEKYSVKDYALNYTGDILNLHINLLDDKKSSLKQLLSLP